MTLALSSEALVTDHECCLPEAALLESIFKKLASTPRKVQMLPYEVCGAPEAPPAGQVLGCMVLLHLAQRHHLDVTVYLWPVATIIPAWL